MKKLIIFLMLLLVSCSTVQYIPVETTKTEYIHKIDTTIIVDSVYVKEWLKSDTVYITKDKYHWIEKIKTDTVFRSDTIPVVQEVEVVKEVIPPYYRTINTIFWIVVGLFILFIVIKIVKR